MGGRNKNYSGDRPGMAFMVFYSEMNKFEPFLEPKRV